MYIRLTPNIHDSSHALFARCDPRIKYINFALAKNPNITASELKKKISNIFHVELSLTTIKKYRRLLGWKATQTGYCQMISEKNKTFRKKWSLFMLNSYEDFKDVVFADETTVEMMSTGQFTFYNRRATIDNKPVKAPKPKHSLKVHVWGGISYHGRTNVCIFSGIMDSITFQGILQENLLPFVQLHFPDGYLLYQDNDSKHTSASTEEWYEKHNVLTMCTPASSPDLNPIENVWSALKTYLRTHEKPKTKDALVAGIAKFWRTLTPEICGRYIDHIHKVLTDVVLNEGGATIY